MQYSVIVVPECETLRKSTADILNEFISRGGKVIFMGEAPKYIDAEPGDKANELYGRGEHIPFEETALLNALGAYRDIEIKNPSGEAEKQFLYQMRKDGEEYSLFIALARRIEDKYCSAVEQPSETVIKIRGEFRRLCLIH